MNFNLSEDQTAFAEMASGLFADFCSDDQLRAHDESGAPFMRELWQQAVAAGLHMVIVAEADGGLGLGMTELMAVLEQQGRALALLAVSHTGIGGPGRKGSTSRTRRRQMPKNRPWVQM